MAEPLLPTAQYRALRERIGRPLLVTEAEWRAVLEISNEHDRKAGEALEVGDYDSAGHHAMASGSAFREAMRLRREFYAQQEKAEEER